LVATGTTATATADWWRNQMAVALAMLIIGTPIWLYYWRGILRRVRIGSITEWRALSRRIFLYVIIGAAILLLAVDMVNIIYQMLRDLMAGSLGANFLRGAKWGMETVVVAALLLWYHWRVLRADQRRGAEAAVARRDVTLLGDNRAADVAMRLENKLGFKIRTLYQIGPTGVGTAVITEDEIDGLVNEIQSSAADKLMVLMLDGRVRVVPFRDR
jgi:hypothetical protein